MSLLDVAIPAELAVEAMTWLSLGVAFSGFCLGYVWRMFREG